MKLDACVVASSESLPHLQAPFISYVSYFGHSILNHVLIIRRIFSVIKWEMYENIAILLFIYCDSIVGAFFGFQLVGGRGYYCLHQDSQDSFFV